MNDSPSITIILIQKKKLDCVIPVLNQINQELLDSQRPAIVLGLNNYGLKEVPFIIH